MKRKIRLIATLTAVLIVFGAFGVGCGNNGGGEDNSLTVLRVYNYDGGVGHVWLDSAIKRFYDANLGKPYESGKTGFKISTYNAKDGDPISTMRNSPYSVYFLEGLNYHSIVKENKMLDISEMVKADNAGEGSIESKLNENTKASLTGVDGKYYGLPHYQSLNGVVYNKTLFKQKGYYFVANPIQGKGGGTDTEYHGYGFVNAGDTTTERTVGPDGVKNTYDDGLPSSMEEFARLVKHIVGSGDTPFTWFSEGSSYQTSFCNALFVSLAGYDAAMSTALLNSNGKVVNIVTGFNGNEPIINPKEITSENFTDIYQSEAIYRVLELVKEIFGNVNNYTNSSVDQGATSNTTIQKEFLESIYNPEKSSKTAMMLEGSYWMNEVKDSGEYDRAVDNYPQIATDLEVEFMPLPVQAKGSVTENNGRKPTTVDALNSYAFINANVERMHGKGVKQLALDFLQFLYTDASLRDFTVKSTVTKNVNYALNSDDKALLPDFSKSVINIRENGAVVTATSSNLLAISNPTVFTLHPSGQFWNSTVGVGYDDPYMAFKSGVTVSVKNYFNGMKKSDSWKTGLNSYKAWVDSLNG